MGTVVTKVILTDVHLREIINAMKQKMLDRMANYVGHQKPEIVQRVTVRSVTETEDGRLKEGPDSIGIIRKSQKKLRIQKML